MMTTHITIANDYNVAQFESLEDAIRYTKTMKINHPDNFLKVYELTEKFRSDCLPDYANMVTQ